MLALPAAFPDLDSLATALAVTIEDRRPNPHASTFPSEILTCRLADGSSLHLLCKYEASRRETRKGHRRGLGYEAEVYRLVVAPAAPRTVAFYGSFAGAGLVVEFLEGAQRANKAGHWEDALRAAARWIGAFHRTRQDRSGQPDLAFLLSYDRDYYLYWLPRARRFTRQWHDRFPVLPLVCDRFPEVLPALLAQPPTIIHGEYYPENILYRAPEVYPVDWQSAAVAPGEIDLAVLTSGWWPPKLVRDCENEYQQARWPLGAPPGFARALLVARLYWCLRALGDRPEPDFDSRIGYLEELETFARQLDCI